MEIISFRHKGDFSKLSQYLEKVKSVIRMDIFNKYGKKGVDALSAATPVDSGKTASSWHYKIEESAGATVISFHNSNINKGVPIALLIQYGHGTRNGGYVQGRDYINPALRPIFDQLADSAWKEVTNI